MVGVCAGELNEMRKKAVKLGRGGGVAQPQAKKTFCQCCCCCCRCRCCCCTWLSLKLMAMLPCLFPHPLPFLPSPGQPAKMKTLQRELGHAPAVTAPYILCCVMCSTLLGVAFVFLVYLRAVGVADRLDSALVTLTTQQLPPLRLLPLSVQLVYP